MQQIIKKFQQLYLEVKKEKGICYFFSAYKMDPYTQRWSLGIAAPWITAENKKENFAYLAEKIKNLLSREEISSIIRLGIFRSNHPFIQEITTKIRLDSRDDKPLHLETISASGYKFYDAYIFAASQIEHD